MSDIDKRDNAELVFTGADGEPFTTSLVIATETGVEHRAVLQLIRNNLADFEEFGLVAFEMRARSEGQHGGGSVTYANLSESQATLLLTYMRNSDIVRAFKKRLVHSFYAMRQALTAPQQPAFLIPKTYAAALRAAAAESERADAAEQQTKMLEAAIERDAPLVAKAEAHTSSASTIHRQEFAREVIAWGRKQGKTIRQDQVMAFLGHIGLFIRGERTDTGHATADAIKRGLAFTDKGTAKNGHAWATGKLTAAGQDVAWKRITKHVADHGTLALARELRGGDPA